MKVPLGPLNTYLSPVLITLYIFNLKLVPLMVLLSNGLTFVFSGVLNHEIQVQCLSSNSTTDSNSNNHKNRKRLSESLQDLRYLFAQTCLNFRSTYCHSCPVHDCPPVYVICAYLIHHKFYTGVI